MPEHYTSGRDPRRNSVERSPRPTGARPQGARPAQGGRPASARPPQGRRPAPRRRKKRIQPRFFIVAAILIALIVALVLILGGKGGEGATVQPQPTPVPNTSGSGLGNAVIATATDAAAPVGSAADTQASEGYSSLAQLLGDEDAEVAALDEADRVQVSDLSVNTSLPDSWTNFLLLGTDERTLEESARTDTMIVCSINNSTGEVKLTSILRDLAVEFDDLGKYNGTYRINSANFFGGPEYAMKTVNECFGLNIQYYATVNFFGFQRIVEALGGIEVNISEAEKTEINRKLFNQRNIANAIGEDAPVPEEDALLTYGPNTHLNGHQTLAYARIRAIDSDISRAERQRTVLTKLMEKLRGKNAAEIIMLVGSLSSNVSTNMDLDTIATIAVQVLGNGIPEVESYRLPVAGTFVEERRNEQAMLYDCDWETNQLNLYNFIYE